MSATPALRLAGPAGSTPDRDHRRDQPLPVGWTDRAALDRLTAPQNRRQPARRRSCVPFITVAPFRTLLATLATTV